ncbi:MAG: 8-oxo-dGTP pyrophosphatase MutT (NUDIX family) [Gammaproteobacteria bacterium]|jgi:8-oxo-dGTP pyrophosphatase MutT (NUDIX family)
MIQHDHIASSKRALRHKPIRPRDAASLLAHRCRNDEHEVLMGRRPLTSRFMPGVYVFPGGAVETQDRHVRPATALTTDVTHSLKVAGSTARARAMAVSAVRETFEETGLILGAPGDPKMPGDPTWNAWAELCLAPDLGALDLIGRAITPTSRPIRFHARFFVADGDRLCGTIGGDGELEDISWVRLRDCADLPLAAPQIFFIELLRKRLNGEAPATRPLMSRRDGMRHVRHE